MNKDQGNIYWIAVYKDSERFLLNAKLRDLSGFLVDSPWYETVNIQEGNNSLGESIFRGFEYIEVSPRFDGYTYIKERGSYVPWLKEGKYDSAKSFDRSCVEAHVWLMEDKSFQIFSVEKVHYNSGSPDTVKEIILAPNAKTEEIGAAIVDVCEAAEYYEKNKKLEKRYRYYKKQEEELICGRKIKYYPPKDKHFEELGGGEIFALYQRYDYYSESTTEDVISVFGIDNAEELDNDLSEENILAAWTKHFGEPETFSVKEVKHGIFTLRAEMFNKKYHRLAYIVKLGDDELLASVMLLSSPHKQKKTDEKLSRLFEEFSENIRFADR